MIEINQRSFKLSKKMPFKFHYINSNLPFRCPNIFKNSYSTGWYLNFEKKFSSWKSICIFNLIFISWKISLNTCQAILLKSDYLRSKLSSLFFHQNFRLRLVEVFLQVLKIFPIIYRKIFKVFECKYVEYIYIYIMIRYEPCNVILSSVFLWWL